MRPRKSLASGISCRGPSCNRLRETRLSARGSSQETPPARLTKAVRMRCPSAESVPFALLRAFSDWRLSLRDLYLSFFHVFSWLDGSSLFSIKEYSVAWTTVCPRFPVWAVTANAALNTEVRASCGHKFSTHLDGHQGVSMQDRADSPEVGGRALPREKGRLWPRVWEEFNTCAEAQSRAELIRKGVGDTPQCGPLSEAERGGQ